MSNIIDEINKEQTEREIPAFSAGDAIVVNLWVREGDRQRLQAFEGVCIAKANRAATSEFTVRKISHEPGVDRVSQTSSPLMESSKLKLRARLAVAIFF